MKKQVADIFDYFEKHSITDSKIESQDNLFGKRISVEWEQDFIRCRCFIFQNENVLEKMQKQFIQTRSILIANIQK